MSSLATCGAWLGVFACILQSGLFAGLNLAELGYRCTQHVSTDLAIHVVLVKDA